MGLEVVDLEVEDLVVAVFGVDLADRLGQVKKRPTRKRGADSLQPQSKKQTRGATAKDTHFARCEPCSIDSKNKIDDRSFQLCLPITNS